MKNKNGFLWGVAFLFILVLTQDYLFITWEDKTSFLGFPIWLSWFMLMHFLFIVVFYFFSKKYWK
ncbi:MAG: hypothetical protein AB8F94_12850 [Saprospiraceae bacterium]